MQGIDFTIKLCTQSKKHILKINSTRENTVKLPHEIGLIGIEPITFRYERNILPLNYRFMQNNLSKIARKSYIKL